MLFAAEEQNVTQILLKTWKYVLNYQVHNIDDTLRKFEKIFLFLSRLQK